MIANMRYRLTVVLGYFAFATWFIYGVVDRAYNVSDGADTLIMVVLPVALGALIGRWWASLLPVAVFLLSIPAGYSADSGLEAPVWFIVMLYQAIAIPLVITGIVARKLVEYVAANRGSRGSRHARGSALPAAWRR